MLYLDFTKMTVVVTGGGSGIRYAIAASFYACGAHVVLCSRRELLLKQAVIDKKKGANVDGHGKIVAIT